MSLAPGWYKDPADPTTQRWWDGEGWVGEPLPAEATPPAGPPPPATASASGLAGQLPAVPGPPGSAESTATPANLPNSRDPEPERERVGAGRRDRFRSSRSTDQRGAPEAGGSPGKLATTRMRVSARPHGYPLATLGARFTARLIDFGIVLALNVVVNGWFVYQYWQEISPVIREAWQRSLAGEPLSELPEVGDQAGYLQLVILILAAALWFAYEVPAVANTGQTPGKRVMKIKVVAVEQDQPISFGRSIRRWNPMGLPVLLWWCFGIGFLLQLIDAGVALFDRPGQQTLHDKSAQTAVVSIADSSPDPERTSEETSDEPADPS